jgi:hypothetical protein
VPIPDYRRQGSGDAPDRPTRVLSGTPGSAGDDPVPRVLLFIAILLTGQVAWSALLLVLGVESEPLLMLGFMGVGLLAARVLESRRAGAGARAAATAAARSRR